MERRRRPQFGEISLYTTLEMASKTNLFLDKKHKEVIKREIDIEEITSFSKTALNSMEDSRALQALASCLGKRK